MSEIADQLTDFEEQFKAINQTPYWDADAELVVSGKEFENLYNFFNLFMPGVHAMQSAFERNVKTDVIKVKYEYADGSGEVPQEELKQYWTKVQELMKTQLQTIKD